VIDLFLQNLSDKDPEGGHSLSGRTVTVVSGATNSVTPALTTPENGDTNSQGSSSKDSSSELHS
jgi:hypothetical protein